jgi:hypothetical protein
LTPSYAAPSSSPAGFSFQGTGTSCFVFFPLMKWGLPWLCGTIGLCILRQISV